MLDRVLSLWVCFHSDRPGFYLGTSVLIIVILFVYVVGIPASLSLGPGGEFPGFGDVLLYAVSHDELSSLLISVGLLLLVGRCQERRWGTIAFLSLSTLTMNVLPLLYTLVLSVVGGEASRICGYSAIQLALFTAHCSQLTQRRVLRCVPVWLLPWLLLLIGLLLLPGTPALLHFCSICIGHNYCQSFIRMFQELEESTLLKTIPKWVYIPVSTGFRLPNYTTSLSSRSLHQRMLLDQAAVAHMRDPSVLNHQPRVGPAPAWIMDETAAQSEAEMLEEQMLRAGILASLQDAPDNPDGKIEMQKSSVSSLRLQQLEKMGFPTEKAVVALAATKQLDGAISLLINDSVGEQAVVVSKGKSHLPPPNT